MDNEKALREIKKAIARHETELSLKNEGFSNGITELPNEIGGLSDLFTLELGFNSLTALPPEIGNLKSLKRLFASRNGITELPIEIGNLSNLEALELKYNKLKNLPLEIRNLEKLFYLDLRGNNLGLPPEIENKIRDPEAILSYYFSLIKYKKNLLINSKHFVSGKVLLARLHSFSGFFIIRIINSRTRLREFPSICGKSTE